VSSEPDSAHAASAAPEQARSKTDSVATVDTDAAAIARQLGSETGLPTQLHPESIGQMLGSAVPLLFAADAARDMDLLRGTFLDLVIAQCQRNAGCLRSAVPESATFDLIGAPVVGGHPVLRAHLTVAVRDADPSEEPQRQVWDLEPNGSVTIGQASCPNCGAPIADRALICGHCHSDVRHVANALLVVSRLELY
jgi:hypothetical protein